MTPDLEKLAARCESFAVGTKRMYEREGERKGDMWFFELWHHLNDCTKALRAANGTPPLADRTDAGEE